MRNKPLKGLMSKSPIKKAYDFSKKKDYSSMKKDYSPEATKGTFGDKIAKAVSPKNILEALPIGKIGKAGKVAWKYFSA